MGRTHPPYAPEFRAEAARLAKSSGEPLRATAEHLGVSVEALRSWVKQAEVDGGEREGLTTDERVELARLRREVRVLRMERDLLKRATVFFARESEPTP
jgi:transposase